MNFVCGIPFAFAKSSRFNHHFYRNIYSKIRSCHWLLRSSLLLLLQLNIHFVFEHTSPQTSVSCRALILLNAQTCPVFQTKYLIFYTFFHSCKGLRCYCRCNCHKYFIGIVNTTMVFSFYIVYKLLQFNEKALLLWIKVTDQTHLQMCTLFGKFPELFSKAVSFMTFQDFIITWGHRFFIKTRWSMELS